MNYARMNKISHYISEYYLIFIHLCYVHNLNNVHKTGGGGPLPGTFEGRTGCPENFFDFLTCKL